MSLYENPVNMDRRKYKRIRLTPLFIEPIQIMIGEKLIPGIIADISKAGMAIITYGKIPLSAKISITLGIKNIDFKKIEGTVLKVRENSNTYLVVIIFDKQQNAILKKLELIAMDFEDCETKWTRGDFNICYKECSYYHYCSKSIKKKF